MIFTDRTVIVQKGTSSINDAIVLYRGDKGVEIRFTLNEGSPFKFGSGSSPNIIEKTEAAYGQLIIKRPNDLPAVFSEIAPTNGGKIVFTITAEMIDEITEVGYYTFQIRLFDENQESRATIPEVIDGIEIREPIASEDGTNEVGVATVGYALTTAGTSEDTFDSQGNYNKTTWKTGDRITAAKLNKIEAGIDGVNQKIASTGAGDISIADTGNYFTATNVEGALQEVGSQIKDIENIKILSNNFMNISVKTPSFIHIMAGMDSLTNGAGGSSWVNYFRDKAFAQLGCGGLGYIGLFNDTIIEFGSWGTTAPSIRDSEYEKYSLDRKGVILSIGKTINLNFINKDFDNCKIIYLKKPNGGKFDCSFIKSGSTSYTIDTNSTTYDLGTFDLEGNDANANGKIYINNVVDNDVVIFGVYCTSNNGGLIVSKLGKGGDAFKNHANLDPTFREKWIDILNPDYLLFNGGTNDERTVQSREYKTLIESYLTSFLNKDVKITCITPNDMIDLTYLPSYAPVLREFCEQNKCSYVDHRKILGEYQYAYNRGLMLDGCHPNNLGNEILSNYWLTRFGLSNLIESKPFNRIWSTSQQEKQYYASLTNKSIMISPDTTETIYNLGFLNAYTGGVLKLLIHGQSGKNNIIKEIYLSFTNNTIANQCAWVSDITSNILYSRKDDNITTIDFTITAELSENKLLIKLTPGLVHSISGNINMYFNIKGEISCAYVGAIGQLVFEN